MIRWFAHLSTNDLTASVGPLLMSAGFEVDAEVSNAVQVFAIDAQQPRQRADQRISCIAQWSDRAACQVEIEVRSSEPMLKRETRCEAAASRLRVVIPPS